MESHMKRHADREGLYQLRMQVGIVLTLLLLILLARSEISGNEQEEQFQAAVAYMPVMLVPPTVLEKKVIPPAPSIPTVVADDVVLDEELTFDASALDLDMTEMVAGPPPAVEEPEYKEAGFLTLAEEMPEIIGGLEAIMKEIRYPEMAKKAGVEGRVIVQFVVDVIAAGRPRQVWASRRALRNRL